MTGTVITMEPVRLTFNFQGCGCGRDHFKWPVSTGLVPLMSKHPYEHFVSHLDVTDIYWDVCVVLAVGLFHLLWIL